MSTLSSEVTQLIVSEAQLRADDALLPFDLWASRAHVCMLAHCQIVAPACAAALLEALSKIELAHQDGAFKIDPARGAQLSIEAKVIELAGEAYGLSLHTARSRNDQIMVTESLFTRAHVIDLLAQLLETERLLLGFAAQHADTVMPGYTHMQPAKPSSAALWALAYLDALQRAGCLLEQKLDLYDLCPLGAVESFGTSWPIDREYTAKLLAFARVWEIPQDAISQRGFFQLEVTGALNQLAIVISKLAQDLMLYSTFEYGMLSFDDTVAQRLHPITGSSVMAQKRNPDALELLRSLAPQLSAEYSALSGLLSGLPSGYNRDPREGKEFFQAAMQKSFAALQALGRVIPSLQVDRERMRELVLRNYSLTTDFADQVALTNGLPYRLVYKVVGRFVDKLISQKRTLDSVRAEELAAFAAENGVKLKISPETLLLLQNPELALKLRKHTGGSNPSELERLCQLRREELQQAEQRLIDRQQRLAQARKLTDQTAAQITV